MIRIEILSVRNPQWANKDKTAIDCLVRTNALRDEVPFTAAPYDPEKHGREIFARCLLGEFGDIAPMNSNPSNKATPQIELPAKHHRLEKFLLEANKENNRQSFRSVVIVWASMIDNLLDEMLAAQAVKDSAIGVKVQKPPTTFDSRIKKADKRGLIDKEEVLRCDQVRKIRNVAAHEWDLKLDTDGILPAMRILYQEDHSELLSFHNDLEFLFQQIFSGSCAMLVMKFIDRISDMKIK